MDCACPQGRKKQPTREAKWNRKGAREKKMSNEKLYFSVKKSQLCFLPLFAPVFSFYGILFSVPITYIPIIFLASVAFHVNLIEES